MKLPKGTFIVGNKLMGVCAGCGKIVRIDKPIIGSFHICREQKEKWETAQYDDKNWTTK